MVRSIGAVVAGYITMAVWVMLSLSVAWMATGPSFAWRAGTTEVTVGWVAINLPLSFVGALLGGLVASLIASRSNRPVKVLALIVAMLGVATAIARLVAGDPEPAATVPTDAGPMQAASLSIQPVWYNFVIAVVGFIGVLVGGRLRKRRDGQTG